MESGERSPFSPPGADSGDEYGSNLKTNNGGSDQEDDDEVYFGPVTDHEKLKAAKLKRRTEVYKPGVPLFDIECEESTGVNNRTESLDSMENKDNTGIGEKPEREDCEDNQRNDDDSDDDDNNDDDDNDDDGDENNDYNDDDNDNDDNDDGELLRRQSIERVEDCNVLESTDVSQNSELKTGNLLEPLSASDSHLNQTEQLQVLKTDNPHETLVENENDTHEEFTYKRNVAIEATSEENQNETTEQKEIQQNEPGFHELKNLNGKDVRTENRQQEVFQCSTNKQIISVENVDSDDTGYETTSRSQEQGEMSTINSDSQCRESNNSQHTQNTVQFIQSTDSHIYSSPLLSTQTIHSYPNIDNIHAIPSNMMSPQICASPVAIAADMVVRKYANSAASPVVFNSDVETRNRDGVLIMEPESCTQAVSNDTDNVNTSYSSPYDKAKADLVEYRRQLLAEKRARLAKIRKEREKLMERLEMDLPKTPPTLAECLKVQTGVGVESIDSLPIVSQKFKEVESNNVSALELDEVELDMVTKLHTMKNRQYCSVNIELEEETDAPSSVTDSEVQGLVANQSRVQWDDGMVSEIPEMCTEKSTPSKPAELKASILHNRPEGFVYPYSELVPMSVVVNKSPTSNDPPSPFPRKKFY